MEHPTQAVRQAPDTPLVTEARELSAFMERDGGRDTPIRRRARMAGIRALTARIASGRHPSDENVTVITSE